ncbi:hypothetical protein CT0861_01337 [Colletotrichum tofieldiae]|uniref:Uncharacterized protein n=1 Tax=Colletotrichum tofieldiae TaxID=708197 RepID=A0A161YI55_9PEZI|nr:hypothetical protein CT0861_01337 [Colletotrichum tofieldiae]
MGRRAPYSSMIALEAPESGLGLFIVSASISKSRSCGASRAGNHQDSQHLYSAPQPTSNQVGQGGSTAAPAITPGMGRMGPSGSSLRGSLDSARDPLRAGMQGRQTIKLIQLIERARYRTV